MLQIVRTTLRKRYENLSSYHKFSATAAFLWRCRLRVHACTVGRVDSWLVNSGDSLQSAQNCPLASFRHPAISEGTRSTKSGRVMRAEDGGEEFGGSLAHAQMNFRFPRSLIPAPICLAGVVLSSISCDRKMSAGVREKKSGGK